MNDGPGHEGGDCVLGPSLPSGRLRQLVGEQGMVAPYGGEELAVAAVVVTAPAGYLLAEKIRHGGVAAFGLGPEPGSTLTISLD